VSWGRAGAEPLRLSRSDAAQSLAREIIAALLGDSSAPPSPPVPADAELDAPNPAVS
jgi:hypothetical protein